MSKPQLLLGVFVVFGMGVFAADWLKQHTGFSERQDAQLRALLAAVDAAIEAPSLGDVIAALNVMSAIRGTTPTSTVLLEDIRSGRTSPDWIDIGVTPPTITHEPHGLQP